jgi:hypothetical protein
MSDKIAFADLIGAFRKPTVTPNPGGRLALPPAPDPFVAPPLRLVESNVETPLAVEVVFVEASAAVGKSTMARYLSEAQSVPLLDLSITGVSTHSLVGLLTSEFGPSSHAPDAFHNGELVH